MNLPQVSWKKLANRVLSGPPEPVQPEHDSPFESERKVVMHPAANVNKVIRIGMIMVLVVFGGFGTWASLAPLAGAVIGRGEVKVDMNRKTIQHLEGGIIKAILVRDGDHVVKGQTLIEVEDERVNASVDVLQGQLDAETAKAARLEAQRDGLDQIRFPDSLTSRKDNPTIASLMTTETNYFNTQREDLKEEVELLDEQIEGARSELSALQEQLKSNEAAAALLQKEIEANTSLEKSQYVEKVRILGLQRNLQEYDIRRTETQASIARARQKISDMKLRIVQTKEDYVQRAVEDLTGVHATGVYAQIFDLKQRLRPSEDELRRQSVVSPVTGTVVEMRVFTVGGVIAPGQPLMDVVPDDQPLIVEAKIAVDDIDEVQEGQKADIRFSAFKRRSTPLVEGTVSYVSADSINDPKTQETYFIIHVDADPKSLANAISGKGELHPGMPAEVYVRTTSRTLVQYLMTPITQVLRHSFRES